MRFIECDLADYTVAYRIITRAIASTYGALPQGALSLYDALRALSKKKADEQGVGANEVSVSQRELREATGLSAMSVKRSLRLLVDYEYLAIEGSRRRGTRVGYRLIRDEAAGGLSMAAIPSPEEVGRKLQSLESGASGSEWVNSGSDPLLRA